MLCLPKDSQSRVEVEGEGERLKYQGMEWLVLA
jgi:hypothetical protein